MVSSATQRSDSVPIVYFCFHCYCLVHPLLSIPFYSLTLFATNIWQIWYQISCLCPATSFWKWMLLPVHWGLLFIIFFSGARACPTLSCPRPVLRSSQAQLHSLPPSPQIIPGQARAGRLWELKHNIPLSVCSPLDAQFHNALLVLYFFM